MAEAQRDRTLGGAIKAARKRAGLTQEALAERLGIHKMTVAKYEANQLSITVDRLAQIADALSAEVLTLLLQAGYSFEEPRDVRNERGEIEPDMVLENQDTGERIALQLTGHIHTPDEMAVLRQRMRDARLALIEVDEEGHAVRSTQPDDPLEVIERETPLSEYEGTLPRLLRNPPLSIREYLAEFRLRLTRGDVPDDEIEAALSLLRSPQVFTFYKGGVKSDHNEEEVLNGIRAIAEGVVIPQLRERGHKIP